jgi:DNA primase
MKRFIDFKQIKQEVGIRRILEHYGHLSEMLEQGDRLSGCCPICDSESKTAFRVSQEKNCFKCFSCDAGGNILDLVCLMEDCSIREAAVMIADWFGIECGTNPRRKRGPRRSVGSPEKPEATPVPKKPAERGRSEIPPTPAEAQSAAAAEPTNSTPQPAEEPESAETGPSGVNPPLSFELKLDPEHPWFEENGIRPETVEHFGLGFCSKGMMRGRIAFPIRNRQGELIGYAGLWADSDLPADQPLWKFPKNLDLYRVAFPSSTFDADKVPLLACDPLMAVRSWQHGHPEVVWLAGLIESSDRFVEALEQCS